MSDESVNMLATEGLIMPHVDYGNYLEQQNEWLHSLEKLVQDVAPNEVSELNQIVAKVRRRLAQPLQQSITE